MPSRLDYLAILQMDVQEKFNCTAVYRESVEVHEVLDGDTIWRGRVEIFELTGHAETKKCYAWACPDKDKVGTMRLITVPASHIINSPQKAVHAAIFYDVQPVSISHMLWKILVVDDEIAVTQTLKYLLELDGHNVQTANNGRDALVLLEQQKFDLVTTDFAMSGMKGDTLAAAIKERLPNQPVLMISTNGALAKAAGNPLPGVDLVISKPFHVEELRKAIATVLQGRLPYQ